MLVYIYIERDIYIHMYIYTYLCVYINEVNLNKEELVMEDIESLIQMNRPTHDTIKRVANWSLSFLTFI